MGIRPLHEDRNVSFSTPPPCLLNYEGKNIIMAIKVEIKRAHIILSVVFVVLVAGMATVLGWANPSTGVGHSMAEIEPGCCVKTDSGVFAAPATWQTRLDKDLTANILFTTAFNNPPRVIVVYQNVHRNAGGCTDDEGLTDILEAQSVTRTGFTLHHKTTNICSGYMQIYSVSWLAVGT